MSWSDITVNITAAKLDQRKMMSAKMGETFLQLDSTAFHWTSKLNNKLPALIFTILSAVRVCSHRQPLSGNLLPHSVSVNKKLFIFNRVFLESFSKLHLLFYFEFLVFQVIDSFHVAEITCGALILNALIFCICCYYPTSISWGFGSRICLLVN